MAESFLTRNPSSSDHGPAVARERWFRISVSEVRQRIVRHGCAITRKEECLRVGCQDIRNRESHSEGGGREGGRKGKKTRRVKKVTRGSGEMTHALIELYVSVSDNKVRKHTPNQHTHTHSHSHQCRRELLAKLRSAIKTRRWIYTEKRSSTRHVYNVATM